MKAIMTKCAAFSALVLLSSGCFVHVNGKDSEVGRKVIVRQSSATLGGKLFTSAWIQRSAEYKALCHQAFNIATERLDAHLASHSPGAKPLAIITDIDETIVDNSPNAVHQALRGQDYTDTSWNAWCDRAEALPLAGAREFFAHADKRGVKIFYVSNRNEVNREGTLLNLRRLGFPQVEDAQLLLRASTSDKTARRQFVLDNYDVVMYLGDNLGDFDHIFDSADEAIRDEASQRMRQEFGKRFIVLPNPNYGTWEKAMNGGYPSLDIKDRKLRTMLRTY